MSSVIPLSEFEQLVLLAVARTGRDAYGMAVREEIVRRTRRSASLAAVYSTLGRLETAGLISSWSSPPTSRRGGRATRHFRLERSGAEALQQSKDRMGRMWDGVELTTYLGQG